MIDLEAVRTFVCTVANVPKEKATNEAYIRELVVDSFALVQLLVEIQDEFDIQLSHGDLQGVETVGQLLEAIAEKDARVQRAG